MLEIDNDAFSDGDFSLIRDPVGRARIRHGSVWFETRFQPYFAVDDGHLVPDFATASLVSVPSSMGLSRDISEDFQSIPGMQQSATLARANLGFLDPESVAYCEDVAVPPSLWRANLEQLLMAANDVPGQPTRLIWRFQPAHHDRVNDIIGEVREAGVGLALTLSSDNPYASMRYAETYGFDMVHLDVGWTGAWLENFPGAETLLAEIVRGVADSGCGVSLVGISSRMQLDMALSAGVKWLAGGWLASDSVVGRVTHWCDLSIALFQHSGQEAEIPWQRPSAAIG